MWNQVKLHVMHRRLSHTATQVGSYLFIIGGHNGSDYTSEILPLNLGSSLCWSTLLWLMALCGCSVPAVRDTACEGTGAVAAWIPCSCSDG
jgi:hypothetical protein